MMLLRPGIGVKRWLALGVIGTFVMVSGIAFALSVSVSEQIAEFGRFVTFTNVLAPATRGVIFGTAGFALVASKGRPDEEKQVLLLIFGNGTL